jgi:flagellar biosynthesis GTPase FlhF
MYLKVLLLLLLLLLLLTVSTAWGGLSARSWFGHRSRPDVLSSRPLPNRFAMQTSRLGDEESLPLGEVVLCTRSNKAASLLLALIAVLPLLWTVTAARADANTWARSQTGVSLSRRYVAPTSIDDVSSRLKRLEDAFYFGKQDAETKRQQDLARAEKSRREDLARADAAIKRTEAAMVAMEKSRKEDRASDLARSEKSRREDLARADAAIKRTEAAMVEMEKTRKEDLKRAEAAMVAMEKTRKEDRAMDLANANRTFFLSLVSFCFVTVKGFSDLVSKPPKQ